MEYIYIYIYLFLENRIWLSVWSIELIRDTLSCVCVSCSLIVINVGCGLEVTILYLRDLWEIDVE